MKRRAKRYLSMLMIIMLVISSINFQVSAAEGTADHIIISQVYGGGGNSGATYTNDFIELYNPTAVSVDLTGWSVQYASAAGTTYNPTPLTGSIGPGAYYLIQEASNSDTGASLPTPNVVGTIAMSGTNGKVALVSSTVPISTTIEATVLTATVDPTIVDFVGYGSTANVYEGSPTGTLSNTKAAIRKVEGIDNNNNGADFEVITPNPRSSATAVETKCETPTASLVNGVVNSGVEITFASTTADSIIEYNIVSADSTTWTTGSSVTPTEDVTYYVRSTKVGLENSDVATFTYTVDVSLPLNVTEAKEVALDTVNVKVQGIVTYISSKNVYIQDSTGAICLYLISNANGLAVGDEVVAMGTRKNYNYLLEIASVNENNMIIVSHGNSIPDRGTATIAELIATPDGKTPGYDHMCEIIKVTGATLTNTGMLSQDGSDLKIFPAVNLTNFVGVAEGDTVDVTLRMYNYNETLEAEIMSMSKVGAENNLYINVVPNEVEVTTGTIIAINCNDETASIYYTLDNSEPTSSSTSYIDGVTIVGNIGDVITLKAFATAVGKTDSPVLTVQYTIKEPSSLTIKDVLALAPGTANVEVTGTIVYYATTYGNPVIQSVVDGQTYSLYIYGAAPTDAKIGDVIKLKGTYTIYGGLPELTSIVSSQIISSGTPIAAHEVTVLELKTNGLSMLGRFVKIKNATLGTYNASSSTPITDATGTINIYRPTSYPTQVVAGDVVDIYAMVACYNTTVQLYVGTKEDNGYNVYDVVNDTKNPVVTLMDGYLDAKPDQDYVVAVSAEDNKGIQDVKISYTIGAITVSDQLMIYDDTTNNYKFTIPGSNILATASSLEFTVTATDVSGLQTVSSIKSIPIDNKPHITIVSPLRNSSTGDDKSPTISVALDNAGTNPVVKLTLKKDDITLIDNQVMNATVQNVIYSYLTNSLVDGAYSVTVVVNRADAQSATETWSFTVGTPQFRAFFGQLHAHTAQYSDGSGTLDDGLNYLASIPAIDNVDFISITDHSNYFDTTAASNPAEALNDKTKMTAASLATWNNYVSTMLDFNASHAGSLVAMPGFEMTWSGGPGHINTFNSDGLVSRNNSTLNNKNADAGMKAYYETLIQNTDPLANLSQFNHPGATFGTFSDFAYWSPAYDNKMVAVEVGNGEGAIGSGGYFPSYSEYTKALDKGWHVAPTNNQDNHKGLWGNANTARTVIITDDLSSTGLLTGLKNMSVYSTEDKNLNISYTVNGLMVGTIIGVVPTEALQFDISIDDSDNDEIISKVEIITNGGRVVTSKTFVSNVAEWSFELPSVQGYYYVRVTEADKNIAVTAPVWVGQAPLVGISSLETNTKMPVTNEALDFTTTLFNNEVNTVTLKTIEYSIGDQILTTEVLNTEIISTGTYKHNYAYTPTVPGNMKITATAVLIINGQEKTFTQDLNIKVRDSEKLVYVGIDASHYNEYVDGNYKDSMGNFADLAVNSDVRVVELDTSEALIAATQNPKFKMLILTPPTRRNGSYFKLGYKNYSDEEIAAIKAFAESGKTVIITGWGDYYEGYSGYSASEPYTLPLVDHMAAQQNKLLLAMGSNLRVSDDEIKDNTNNGGQPQRLYLNNYNLDNMYLANVKPAEQVYSCYGGSTVYAIGNDGLPSTTLATTISPMVYAFSTSYSSDDDNSGTTNAQGVLVPKYNDKFLVAASETVTYGNGNSANIIVAGSAFMSNFEVQVSMDSYSTPAYSNYTILENIVSIINPVTISNISTVQAAGLGETFTIEGIVTSNASGFDKNTALFDCIYLQDKTAGINAFPVAGDVRAGQTVRITGTTSAYNGERQIAVEKITIIDETIKPLPTPILESTAQAASGDNLGSLVKITGNITSLVYTNNVIESIFVKDSSNVICRVFIDGYITKDTTIENLVVGSNITAIGLSSIDTEGARIRVRDRADVVCTVADDKKPKKDKDNNGNGPKAKTKTKGNMVTSSMTFEDKIQLNGLTSVFVSENNVTQLLEELKVANVKNKKSILEFNVETSATENNVAVVINRVAFNQITANNAAELIVSTGLGTIQMDAKALQQINAVAGSEDISIGILKIDNNTLSSKIQKIVGNSPVYVFKISSGINQVTSFGKGSIQISLPYELQGNKKGNALVVYYIDDSGMLQTVRGKYNAETEMIEFMTSHF